MPQATSAAHQTMSHWLLFTKKIVGYPKLVGSSINFHSIEICMRKIKNVSNFHINGVCNDQW